MAFLASFINRQFISEPPVPKASFVGKTVIITGANSGLGLEAVRWVVKLGASQVIIVCRNVEKGKTAAKDIVATTSCSPDILQVWQLDMSSYASVQAFSNKVKTELPRVDVVIANAGIQTRNFKKTEDNEETINTNVISSSLLAFLLHSKLRETAMKFKTQTHLTYTASELYEVAKFKESKVPDGKIFATLNDQSKADMSDRYPVSKLLGIFAFNQIAALSPVSSSGVIVNSVAPGMCDSELHREVQSRAALAIMKKVARTTEVGARTLVHGASAGPESHGQYLPDCKITPLAGLTKGKAGAELQNRFWLELKQKLEAIQPGITSLS